MDFFLYDYKFLMKDGYSVSGADSRPFMMKLLYIWKYYAGGEWTKTSIKGSHVFVGLALPNYSYDELLRK